MKTGVRLLLLLLLACAGCRSTAPHQTPIATSPDEADLPGMGEDSAGAVSDPLEPMNRVFFHFNDKFYFWVLKPVARGYDWIMPQPAQRGVKNFFSNLATPVRLVNCGLQANVKGAWTELERFVINTTVGVAGFGDPARNRWHIEKRNEDLGQTLGRYGIGSALYINWPILGPSCARDTVGFVGDLFLDPLNYLVPDFAYNAGIRSYETVNGTALSEGEYEQFKDAAIDPYVALRDAYFQYRRNLVKNGADAVPPAGPLPVD